MGKIIVFGTGKYGKEAYDFFGDDNVLCFADNNAALTGKYLYEKEIILPSDIQSHYKECLIILAAREELCIEMEYQLMKMGIENSLKKSGLEYFDLYLLHQAMGDYFAAWRAMEDAYHKGKLRAIGVSNFYPNILTNFCEIVEIKPMVNQIELHPYFTQEQAIETMKYYDVVPEAWAPLGGGRYNPFEDEMLKGIAEKYHKTVGQVLLRWNIQRDVVVIPKSTHIERIIENINVFDFELNNDEMKKISSLDMGYSGSRAKHFEPDFVRMVVHRKIHE